MSYNYLNIAERELIAIYRARSWSICQIAKELGRNKSTIARELKRNHGEYLPSKAQERYRRCRKKSCPHKKLENPDVFKLVKELFLDKHFSPEQKRSEGNHGARRKLRHKGKPRRPKGYVSNRGKIPISHELSERPVEANQRSRFGDFEVDTIVGKNRKSGLLTLVDRKSRFLLCCKLSKLGSKEVEAALIKLLRGKPLHSITSDRGREFQLHGNVTAILGVAFYFAPAHQPWQRGTSEASLQAVVEQLNKRPRKCLGYKTPWEIWFSTSLHFV